jgi:ubiquinone/menaquinone biosynthesis C-methylase UbiE
MMEIVTNASLVLGYIFFVILAHVLTAVAFVVLFLAIDCMFTPLCDEALEQDLKLIQCYMNIEGCIHTRSSTADIQEHYNMTMDRDYAIMERVMGSGLHTRLRGDMQYRYIDLDQATHVLEIGSGRGHAQVLARTHPDVHFTGVDVVARHIEMAKNAASDLDNMEYIQADATDNLMWLGERRFQVIFGVESLRHMDTDRRLADFVSQMRRLLAPGGRLVIVDIFRRSDFASAKPDQQMATMIAECGLFVLKLRSKEEWIHAAGIAPIVNVDITAKAMPFWTLGWRFARFCLFGWEFLDPFARVTWSGRFTFFNLITMVAMGHAMRDAAEYGVLVFEFP